MARIRRIFALAHIVVLVYHCRYEQEMWYDQTIIQYGNGLQDVLIHIHCTGFLSKTHIQTCPLQQISMQFHALCASVYHVCPLDVMYHVL